MAVPRGSNKGIRSQTIIVEAWLDNRDQVRHYLLMATRRRSGERQRKIVERCRASPTYEKLIELGPILLVG
ncbi:hypothetical protein RRF57_005931 [Xylaria bambusicola]|uniref:Uncharacterized protein n=1 Tax=Xylaria bambusicola TaxID=326684 RepID=A0AAN7Z9J3_9PEZI